MGHVLSQSSHEPANKICHPLQCQQLIKTLLAPQPLLPSLPHFIRALNMVKYRRYLEMEDLFQKTGDNLIDTRFYDCPAPVSEKISKFVHESAQKIQQLHQHWSHIQRMKNYLPRDEENRIDLLPLVHYYEKSPSGEPRKYSFTKDKDSILVYLFRFLELLEKDFTELLNGQVTLTDHGKVVIFEPSCFELSLAKLHQAKQDFDQLTLTFPNFTRNRYFELLRGNNQGAIAIERETMMLISGTMKILHRIAHQLSHLLTHNMRPVPGEQSSQKTPTKTHPIALISLKETNYTIPYSVEAIKGPASLKGSTIEEALALLTRLCYLTHAHFSSSDFQEAMRREKKLEDEIKAGLKTFGRVAQKEQCQNLDKMIFPFSITDRE